MLNFKKTYENKEPEAYRTVNGVQYDGVGFNVSVIIDGAHVFSNSYVELIDAAMARRAIELKCGWDVDYKGSAQQYIDQAENGEVPQQYFTPGQVIEQI